MRIRIFLVKEDELAAVSAVESVGGRLHLGGAPVCDGTMRGWERLKETPGSGGIYRPRHDWGVAYLEVSDLDMAFAALGRFRGMVPPGVFEWDDPRPRS